MQRTGNSKAHKHKEHLGSDSRYASDQQSEPSPEESDSNKLQQTKVEERARSMWPLGQHESVGIGEEIETSETHDDVV